MDIPRAGHGTALRRWYRRRSTVVAALSVLRLVVGKHLARFTSLAPEAGVAVGRMEAFLKCREVRTAGGGLPLDPGDDDTALVRLEKASFARPATAARPAAARAVADEAAPAPALTNVTFAVQPGEIVAVTGPVGAGKSSLLEALLGELDLREGTASAAPACAVAYAPQMPAVFAATLKENILFGREVRADAYAAALAAAELSTDLADLPNGDATQIGERGVNLSGGQMARVNVARALRVRRADLPSSRRRRGRDVDIPSRRVAATAAAAR